MNLSTKNQKVLLGGSVVVVVAVALVLVLMPSSSRIDVAPDPEPSVPVTSRGTDDVAMRDEAFEVVRQLIEDFPGNVFAMGLMGTVHNAFGNTMEAEKWWRRCLERDPTLVGVYDVLSIAFLRKGEYEKVADLLRRVQEVDPTMPQIHRRYAEALLELGKLDEALAAMETEMKITPGLSETHFVLGKIYLQREEYENALSAYKRAAQLRPYDSRPFYGLATASARLGLRDKAKEYMATFSELKAQENDASTSQRRAAEKPRQATGILAEVLVDAGREYGRHRQFQKAEASWQRAATLDPTNAQAREELVTLYRAAKRGQNALEMCDQLRKIDPMSAAYNRMTGVVLTDLKQYGDAETAMRRAIELAPEDVLGHQQLLEVLILGKQKRAEAETLAEKVVELAPTARNYYLLSLSRSGNQNQAGALTAMKQAAEMAPDDKVIQRAYSGLQKRNEK